MDIDSPLSVNDYPCVIYKLTCSKTGKIYYGSTKNSLNYRASKGYHRCTCKDFVDYKKEVIEFVENIDNLLEREAYYIANYPCVNRTLPIYDHQRRLEKDRNNVCKKLYDIRNRKKIVEEKRFYCSLCDLSFQAKSKLTRHNNGYRHKLKNECFIKYGNSWKEHYYEDNKKRYERDRKLRKEK